MNETQLEATQPNGQAGAKNLVRLTREEQLALQIGDVVWVSDHGNMEHCYEYEIKPLTGGKAVGGISLREAKRKDRHVFKAGSTIQHRGPMVDLELLVHTSGMTLRRALTLYYIGQGTNCNSALATALKASRSLVSHEIKTLHELGYLHEPGPMRGRKIRPIRMTHKGTRLLNKMMRKY